MQRYRARRVLRADRRGSSWPVLIETDAGVFHTKLRGAAQAPTSLVAEIIVGGLADVLGLAVPARALIEVGPDLPTDDRNDELQWLLRASVGVNLGFQQLPAATDFKDEDVGRVDPDTASAIAWLDGLVLNPDRTARNPNLLWSHQHLWLIDHGACLGFHHDWPAVTEQTPRAPGFPLSTHLLHSRATRLAAADQRLAPLLDRPALEAAVEAVPAEHLAPLVGAEDLRRRRAAYVAYLRKRLAPPRPFVPSGWQSLGGEVPL